MASREAFWHPVLTWLQDQTGIAHALKPEGLTALPLCGTGLKHSTLGGGFKTAKEAGTRECRNCRRILNKR